MPCFDITYNNLYIIVNSEVTTLCKPIHNLYCISFNVWTLHHDYDYQNTDYNDILNLI